MQTETYSLQQGIAPLAQGLSEILMGTGITSDCWGGACGSCNITGQKSNFITGESCYALLYFNYITTAVDVVLKWLDTNGNQIASNSWHLNAPPAGQYYNCWKVCSFWNNNLPTSLVGNPSVEVLVNGQWAGTKFFVVAEAAKNVRIDIATKNTGTKDDSFILGYDLDGTGWVKDQYNMTVGQQITRTYNTVAKYGSHTLYVRLWDKYMAIMSDTTKTFTVS